MIDTIDKIVTSKGYILGDNVGKGSYSTCFKVYSQTYKMDFVCKVIEVPKTDSFEVKKQSFKQEIDALIQMIHPNIIKIYDYFTEENYLLLILEYCPGGTLETMVREHGKISTKTLLNILPHLLSALKCCHAVSISHNDIKPSNIYMGAYERVKLADFGLARFTQGTSTNRLGSRAYMAPEVLDGKEHDPFKADIWSLGVTIYQLATGHLPWSAFNLQEYIGKVKSGIISIPHYIDSEIACIIKKTVQIDPEQRATIDELCSLPLCFNYLSGNSKSLSKTMQLCTPSKRKNERSFKKSSNRRSLFTMKSQLSFFNSSSNENLAGSFNKSTFALI